jgi:nucleotide-binding universal stress UspA family protein
MEKKCLIPVHKAADSLKAVDYVAEHVNPDAEVTLFNVLPDPNPACKLDGPSLIPSFKEHMKAFCLSEEAEKAAIEGFMEEAKKTLVKAGFPSKNVSMRARKKKVGIAKDIAKEATEHQYDTLVMGRRSLSGINKLLTRRVSDKVRQLAKDVSVVVVD